MHLPTMSREDLEVVILTEEILPVRTSADLSKIEAMSTESLREAVADWIEAGDETEQ